MKNSDVLDISYDLVFILDCLPEDEYNIWNISQNLKSFFITKEVNQYLCHCKNKAEILNAFDVLNEFSQEDKTFCLHIVSHGNVKGFGLNSTTDFIAWSEFEQNLTKMNKNMSGNLIVNMTSCFGINGIKSVDVSKSDSPFFGLIGYKKGLKPSRAKEINCKFYQNMIDGFDIPTSVNNVKNVLNDNDIYCITSSGYKKITKRIINYFR